MFARQVWGKALLQPTLRTRPTHLQAQWVVVRHASSNRYQGKGALVIESQSKDPFFNLSLEHWLFQTSETEQPILLFYRNSPSVIIGRNQTPWKEINLTALREAGIPFLRRRSGGGTVYHDEGNTNYSVMINGKHFDRRSHAEMVARGLVTLDIPAYVNERNDVTVDGFKISSAYKISTRRAYHHGTMLLNAQLGTLGAVLHNEKHNLQAKGVASVRSEVRNLSVWNPSITHDLFVEAVKKEFQALYTEGRELETLRLSEETEASNDHILKGMEELKSWDWMYGQTPALTNKLTKEFDWGTIEVHIGAKKGLITDCTITHQPESLMAPDYISQEKVDSMASALVGLKYGLLDESELRFEAEDEGVARAWKQMTAWLKAEM
ncbi:Lipoyltransferase and lipoate-protein ligase [Clavulina sp. PMI_390]|nr:Lipoyltransferase and lipoate-protein ligase [Clavulina sp. PMI_390]